MTHSSDLDIDSELAAFEAEERTRLGLDAGGKYGPRDQWVDRMTNAQFKKSERPHTTILCGGLTIAHDYLVEGALSGLGYTVRALNCPDEGALRFGKEFGNRGQCNPTHFTVGNLIQELARIRDQEGLSSQEVVKNYIFLTAGACGPCRFGMYVTEYRKALRDAGFDGFRVVLFQQTGGLKQATGEEAGLDLSPPFFLALAKALFSGDILNVASYRLRPYEVVPGSTNIAFTEAKRIVHDALRDNTSIVTALRAAGKVMRAVEVDRLRPKPKISILGEFWAMTTEGDGNYHLQEFIESEGGENDIQVLCALLLYNLWEFRHDTEARANLKGEDTGPFGLHGADVGRRLAGLWMGEIALRSVFHFFAALVGLRGVSLPDMDTIASVGHSHYNVNLRGGEGHLEVAKLIMNVVHNKAHMTLSVKPFGCMPSSGVSDGVQTVITERFPEAIFCAVETSGDGAVNFYSRVQMSLFKARRRAEEEMQATLDQYGITREELAAYLPKTIYKDGLVKPMHVAAGGSADLVHALAPLVKAKTLPAKVAARARLKVAEAKHFAETEGAWAWRSGKKIAPLVPALVAWIAEEAPDYIAPGLKPALSKAWNDNVRDRLWPNAEDQASVTRAEQAAALAPKDAVKKGRTLEVVA